MAYDPTDAADKKIVADLIKVALQEQAAEHEQDVQGLKDKRDELLAKLKKAEKGENGAEEVSRLEIALEKAQGDLKEAAKTIRATEKKAKEFEDLNTAGQKTVRELLVDNGLTDALTKANVAVPFIPAVKSLLSNQVEIKTVDGKTAAFVGDKPLGEFVTTWSQGDDGKHYISAPNNAGSGAQGANNKLPAGTKTILRAEYDKNPSTYSGELASGAATLVDG
jgi:hypothetical protein